ncbi:EAL domain-containing protein [Paraburkholderia sp. BR10872]|uniref:EAL domain-containing protein n=1 Tax=Paraburkholderia sp. BR10872 TaxID=3236989 RepID=UPI0034D27B09
MSKVWSRMRRSMRTVMRRRALERGLRRAIGLGELYLVWQPIVDGMNNTVVGAEALLRWNSHELGPVSPVEFIPVAEDSGLIIPIGNWVIRQACRQVAEWRRTLAPKLFVSVNVSPVQVRRELVGVVETSLHHEGIEASALELELTERLLLRDSGDEGDVLRRLAAAGIMIAMDDYGTGYASLSYLRQFPLHNLKVDRSFVADLPESQSSSQILHAVVSMAHAMGMITTVEGVETQNQSKFLRTLGCDRQQGFFHGRPVSDHEYAQMFVRAAGPRPCEPAQGRVAVSTPQ